MKCNVPVDKTNRGDACVFLIDQIGATAASALPDITRETDHQDDPKEASRFC